jgi:hypothetical protein
MSLLRFRLLDRSEFLLREECYLLFNDPPNVEPGKWLPENRQKLPGHRPEHPRHRLLDQLPGVQ